MYSLRESMNNFFLNIIQVTKTFMLFHLTVQLKWLQRTLLTRNADFLTTDRKRPSA